MNIKGLHMEQLGFLGHLPNMIPSVTLILTLYTPVPYPTPHLQANLQLSLMTRGSTSFEIGLACLILGIADPVGGRVSLSDENRMKD